MAITKVVMVTINTVSPTESLLEIEDMRLFVSGLKPAPIISDWLTIHLQTLMSLVHDQNRFTATCVPGRIALICLAVKAQRLCLDKYGLSY